MPDFPEMDNASLLAVFMKDKDECMELYELFIKYFPVFTKALGLTLRLTLLSLLAATVIGIVVGMIRVARVKVFNQICQLYVWIFRSTPLLVQIYFVYFGIPMSTGIRMTPFTAGLITLSLNAGAYMSEIVRGGIESVDKGQMEAARSLGLSYGKSMSKIVLPQALRTMLPSIVNQFIISLKDTSLLSAIGVSELTNNAKNIVANTGNAMPIWAICAIYYIFMITILSRIAAFLERRTKYGK